MNNSKLQFRRASSNIKLVDIYGEPIKNQIIEVKLKNHEFLFGCGVPQLLEYTLPNVKVKKEVFEERMRKWLDLFNYGTMHFYWGIYEHEEGKTNEVSLKRAANFLKENNVTMKGHPLCWHTACAEWLLKYNNLEIIEKQKNRIRRDVSSFAGLVDCWDVINEVVIMPEYDRYDNAITRICKELGRVKTVKTMFEEAKAANPNACLLINDFNLSKDYESLIDECLNAGVPINAIGIQTHQHQGYMGSEKLYHILERFGKFGLPLHFTENTVISGDLMPRDIVDLNDYRKSEWPSTIEGEVRQANELEEMYRILFGHPLVEAITAWDFADGAWLGAPAGLIRKDNSSKLSYDMLKYLIKEEWSTKETLKTNENGWITMEGFKGEYSISTISKSGSYKLESNNQDMIVVLE